MAALSAFGVPGIPKSTPPIYCCKVRAVWSSAISPPMMSIVPYFFKSCRNRFPNRKLNVIVCLFVGKYSLQGTTQGRYLTGGVPPVRFSM